MADLKISQLTGATTPLAGTEVLPIVQSSTTKKVAVSDLTAGRAVSALSLASATVGAAAGSNLSLQADGATKVTISTDGNVGVAMTPSAWNASFRAIQFGGGASIWGGGAGAASTYVGNNYFINSTGNRVYIANSTATEYAQLTTGAHVFYTAPTGTAGNTVSFTQRFTVSDTAVTVNVDNIVMGGAAKGINFTANTPLGGMTSQLLNWYEEGTYTATITAGSGSYTTVTQSLQYTRIGRVVHVNGFIEIINSGTAGTYLAFTLPYNVSSLKNVSFGGRENVISGLVFGGTTISTSTVAITKYDGTYLGGDGYNFPISFSYAV